MPSSPTPPPPRLATALLIFLVAVPLMTLVAIMFATAVQLPLHPAVELTPLLEEFPTLPAAEVAVSPPIQRPTSAPEEKSSSELPRAAPAANTAPVTEPELKVATAPDVAWPQPRRDLLVEELNKDVYEAVTELKAALEGQSWDDAARLVAGMRPQQAYGVAPAIGDSSLLTCLPIAIATAFKDFPQVAAIIEQKFAATAKLRIAEARLAADVPTLELAAVQFATLPAAAEAYRWLADRALVEGHFQEAVGHYQQVIQLAPQLKSEIASQLRLAAAMNGRDVDDPIGRPTKFDDVIVSSDDFEALVVEMRGKHAAEAAAAPQNAARLPDAAAYQAELRSRFDGPAGQRLEDKTARRMQEYRVPWVDRQLAVAVDGGAMYFSNRFHVAAYDFVDGKRRWQTKPLPHTTQRAQEWPLVPMRPLVDRDRIFVRLLYSANPVLACFAKSTGELLWTAETAEREAFVSDPLRIDERIVILSLTSATDETAELRQVMLSPRTGDVLSRQHLVRLRSSWWSRRCAEVGVTDDEGLIAVLGGVTLATKASGEVRWVRKHSTVSGDDESRALLQNYDRPLVAGSRLFVSQPGVNAIQCLEIATGRSIWQVDLPEVVGIVGLAGERLIVRTSTDLSGLDAETGAPGWSYSAANLVGFPECDDRHVLFATAEPAAVSGGKELRFQWLNTADGSNAGTFSVAGLHDPDPQLGPIVCSSDKVFALFGRGQQDTDRDVMELLARRTSDWGDSKTSLWPPPTLPVGGGD